MGKVIRLPVIWLHFQDCTGCTETLLRPSQPDLGDLILNVISLEYHETLMAESGKQAEQTLSEAAQKYSGKDVCVVEGSIPTKDNGIYMKLAGRSSDAGMACAYHTLDASGRRIAESEGAMRKGTVNPRASIIGLGNVLRGDDGFGCWVVEVFRSEYRCGPEVEIIDLGTPGLDLAPYLYGKDLVVIVDAITGDGKPGTVHTYRESAFLDCRAQLRLTDNDPGLQECLAQLHLAGHGPFEVVVVGVIPESCAFGEGISSTVLAAASLAVVSIGRVLRGRGFDCRMRRRPVQPKVWWVCDCARATQSMQARCRRSPHEQL